MAPPTIKTAHLLLARVLEGNSPGLQIMLKQHGQELALPSVDLAQSVAPEDLKKEECWAVVKAAVEKDWGAEVPPAFKIIVVPELVVLLNKPQVCFSAVLDKQAEWRDPVGAQWHPFDALVAGKIPKVASSVADVLKDEGVMAEAVNVRARLLSIGVGGGPNPQMMSGFPGGMDGHMGGPFPAGYGAPLQPQQQYMAGAMGGGWPYQQAPHFPKFTFPVHIFAVMARPTGPCLHRNKLAGIGAALIEIKDIQSAPVKKEMMSVGGSPIANPQLFKMALEPGVLDTCRRAGGAEGLTVTQLDALQQGAKSEDEAVRELVAFFEKCVRMCPTLFVACENPLLEIGMIELAAARADASFVSLAHTAAQVASESAGKGGQPRKDLQRFLPMDVISFACGLLPQSVEHKTANAGRWAALKEYLMAAGNRQEGFVDQKSPYPPVQGQPATLDQEATNMGWMFGNALCLLAVRFGPGVMAQAGYPQMQPGMMMGGVGMNPYAAQQMMYQQQQQHHYIMQMYSMQQNMQNMQNMQQHQQQQHPGQQQAHMQQMQQHQQNQPGHRQHRVGKGAGGYQGNNQYGQYGQGMGGAGHQVRGPFPGGSHGAGPQAPPSGGVSGGVGRGFTAQEQAGKGANGHAGEVQSPLGAVAPVAPGSGGAGGAVTGVAAGEGPGEARPMPMAVPQGSPLEAVTPAAAVPVAPAAPQQTDGVDEAGGAVVAAPAAAVQGVGGGGGEDEGSGAPADKPSWAHVTSKSRPGAGPQAGAASPVTKAPAHPSGGSSEGEEGATPALVEGQVGEGRGAGAGLEGRGGRGRGERPKARGGGRGMGMEGGRGRGERPPRREVDGSEWRGGSGPGRGGAAGRGGGRGAGAGRGNGASPL